MGQAVDQEQRGALGRRRRGQRHALRVGDDGVVAPVHQDEPGPEPREVAALEVEARHVAPHADGQAGDERRHQIGLAVGEQGVHRPSLGPQRGHQVVDVGLEVAHLARRHRLEQGAVARVLEARRVALDEHPLAVGVGGAVAPRIARALAVIAGGEEGHHGVDVVVAADRDHEGEAASGLRFERGQERRPHGVGDGDEADRRAAALAGQEVNGVGDVAGVLGRHLLLFKPRHVGDQHREAGARERRGEGHQALVVLALGRHPRHQHQRRGAFPARQIEVARALASLDPVSDRAAPGLGPGALEAARAGARREVGEDLEGLERAGRRAGHEGQSHEGGQRAGPCRSHLAPSQSAMRSAMRARTSPVSVERSADEDGAAIALDGARHVPVLSPAAIANRGSRRYPLPAGVRRRESIPWPSASSSSIPTRPRP